MSQKAAEIYVSVDIEASGPIPGKYSMLSLGACVVDDPAKTFYVELQPINDEFVPEALAVSKLNLEHLKSNGHTPVQAMTEFEKWIKKIARMRVPVFVGFNACFDWAFVNWYFIEFLGSNPFGMSGIDIKSFYMGLGGVSWNQTRSSQLPDKFKGPSKQTHNALDDARAQGEIFCKLLLASGERSGG